MLKNTLESYGVISVLLHWSMAVLMLGMFALGLYMVELEYYDSWYLKAPHFHESIGMLLFSLLLFRVFWRLINPLPAFTGKGWEQTIALLTHRSHYALMLIIVISGYLIPTAAGAGVDVFNWFTVPAFNAINTEQTVYTIGQLHWISAWGMILLTGLHTLAALKHHFIDRDNTLTRMFGSTRQ